MHTFAASRTSDGYVTDVAYPDYVHRELMPQWMCSALQALGRRSPDIQQPFTWLELGCGTGMSAVIAAATYPSGHFFGIDVNPQAIHQAQAMAEAAGLGNVQFICTDFETLLREKQVPWKGCDFIVSHGVYSWVSPHNRHIMRQLLERWLLPGGVCYLAYMSHPGSATVAAAQKLAQLHAKRSNTVSSTKQVQAALALLQRTAAAGTGYFTEHPRLTSQIDTLARMDPRYAAHEFLNDHWDCLHVADVISDMASVQCEWAGSATLLENIDAASLPQGVLPLLMELKQQGADAREQETLKDIARNQNQRRDLYQRAHPQGNVLTADEHRQQLLRQRITLTPTAPAPDAPSGHSLRLDTRIGPVDMPMAHIQPLLTHLQQGPCCYADLLQHPLYAKQPALVSQLLQTLCWAGWIQFVHNTAPDAQTLARVHRLNQVLATRPCEQPSTSFLAAAATGSAIPVPGQAPSLWLQQRMHWLGIPSDI